MSVPSITGLALKGFLPDSVWLSCLWQPCRMGIRIIKEKKEEEEKEEKRKKEKTLGHHSLLFLGK